jgi:hypothetical protein
VATSVFVRNGDVYAGGIEFDVSQGSPDALPFAVLWRNNEVHRRIPESGHINLGKDLYPEADHRFFNSHVYSPFLAKDGGVYALIGNTLYWEYGNILPGPVPPAFWNNGEIKYLDVPAGDVGRSTVHSLLVTDGGDVYILGYVGAHDEAPASAVLWKNGAPLYLGDGGNTTYPIALSASGEDVYALVGEYVEHADQPSYSFLVWKNGVRHLKFPRPTSRDPEISPEHLFYFQPLFFVSGEDAYIVGGEGGKNYTVWKNGERLLELKAHDDDGDSYGFQQFMSLFISGEDVYLAGTVIEYTVLTEPSDGTLYTGDLYRRPAVWKNGEKVLLPLRTPNAKANHAEARAVCVQGDDVYVAGYESYACGALLWINGVPQDLQSAVPPE